MKSSEVAVPSETGFRGYFYKAAEPSDKTIIVVIGDEGNDMFDRICAKWLTRQQNCNALCVALRQDSKEDTGVHCWPVERIESAVKWLRERGYTKTGILGMSIQGALALTAASLIPDISLVIAMSPCDFVPWGFYHGRIGNSSSGEWPSGTSAFTWRGEELPFQPSGLYRDEYWDMYCRSRKKYHEMHSISIFEHSEKEHPVTEECFIKAENINGTIVLTGAKDDSMWNSAGYIERMCRRLESKGFSHPVRKLVYRHGTHLLLPGKMLSKGLPVIGRAVPLLFASGRKNRRSCMKSSADLETGLSGIIAEW